MRQIVSESCAEDARERHLDSTAKSPSFTEIISTFNHNPGADTWAAQCTDGSWVNMAGEPSKSLPQYYGHADLGLCSKFARVF